MTYRNDLEAAHARIETLEREKRELEDQTERLNARLRASRPKVKRRLREKDVDRIVNGITMIVGFAIIAIAEAIR
jgi:multidrug resistance efflux pump